MIYIISGTNRPGSRSLEISKIIKSHYDALGASTELIDLAQLPLNLLDGSQYQDNKPKELVPYFDKMLKAEGFHIVCPEYNGSYPGVLKYFIDHWKYPESYEKKTVAFVGLGGRFGGMRPVEHLQQIFGYRNSYIFSERVFFFNVWSILNNGEIKDEMTRDLLKSQVENFCKFTQAIKDSGLHSQVQ